MASNVYPITLRTMLESTAHLENLTALKAALVTTSYTYSNAHDFYDDVSANVVGTPQTCATPAVTSSGDTVTFDAADPSTFSAVAGGSTIGYVVFYDDTGTPGTSKLIACSDVTDTATNGGDITIAIHASGIFTIAT